MSVVDGSRGACRESPFGPRVLLVAVTAATASCADGRVATVVTVADSIAVELLTPPPAVAGVAIAASAHGELLVNRAYGVVDPAAGRPLEPSHPQRIASLTKQFTAAAIMALVDRGRIDLDAPLPTYLPDFDTQGHPVTVRHLLNHTSGIASYSALYAGTGRQPVPRMEVLDTLQVHPFDFPPGDAYRYGNSGYYLLGVVLEEVTGVPYARHLEERFFGPLGMDHTGYCGDGGVPVVNGYRTTAEGLEPVMLDDRTDYLGGSGGLCSTAADLVTWQRALATGRVVTPESYALMTAPTVVTSGDTVPVGFGTDLGTLEGREVVALGGSLAGFNARMAYYPDAGLAVAVLVNTNTTKAETIQDAVARAALGMERVVPVDLPLSAEERAIYVGRYDLGMIVISVFEDGERLVLQPAGQTAARLLFQGEHAFLADVAGGVRVEFTVEGVAATQLALYQGPEPLAGRRVEP